MIKKHLLIVILQALQADGAVCSAQCSFVW